MIVEGEFVFDGPREAVAELLLDPEVLQEALPGAKKLERMGEHRYQGVMFVGVGPVTAAEFDVTITLEHVDLPESYSMRVDGKGSIGFTRGTAQVELSEIEEGRTRMGYRADLQVGGKIAGVGQRLIDSVGKTMTKQGLERLNSELESRLGRAPVPLPARRPKVVPIAAFVLLLLSLFVLCGAAA